MAKIICKLFLLNEIHDSDTWQHFEKYVIHINDDVIWEIPHLLIWPLQQIDL
jgi:hypothetical protein